jgi:hypothetical protein
MRSKSREMTTMTEQTEATIHVGVYSSVIAAAATPPASAAAAPTAMVEWPATSSDNPYVRV